MKKFLILFLGVLALTFGGLARAWDGHYGGGHYGYSHGGRHGVFSHFGFQIGVPLPWPRVVYYRDPYLATQVVVERQPQVYVQREAPAATPAASNFWYYCPDSQTYYPYAQSCPSPWLQVVPQTSPQASQ